MGGLDQRSAVLSLGSNMSIYTPRWMDFQKEENSKEKIARCLMFFIFYFLTAGLIFPFRCHAALKNHVPFFPIITEHSRKRQPLAKAAFVCVSWRDCLRSVSFSPLRSSAPVSKYSAPPSPLPLDCANHLFCSVTSPPTVGVNLPPPPERSD